MVKSRDSQAGSGQDMLAVRQISDDRIERIALRLALDSGSLARIIVGIFLGRVRRPATFTSRARGKNGEVMAAPIYPLCRYAPFRGDTQLLTQEPSPQLS